MRSKLRSMAFRSIPGSTCGITVQPDSSGATAAAVPRSSALALLADYLADDQEALDFYQSFKFAVVAGLPHRRWELTGQQIDEALRAIREHERAKGGNPC